MNKVKDRIQTEFANKFLSLNKRRATIISATGTGKSKICLNILDKIHHEYNEIKLFVNANRLRDVTWKEEFKKWNRLDLLAKTELVNYQSSYKWNPIEKPMHKTLFIYDECDFALGTPQYGKIFSNYDYVDSLGLTGYCADSKREELNSILPIIVEYPFEQAVEDGVINDVKLYFVKFDLDTDPKGIKVSYKDKVTKQQKEFYQSENAAYDYADSKFRMAYGAYEKGVEDHSLGIIDLKKLKALEYKKNMTMKARVDLLYNGIASAKISVKLIDLILINDNNKVITFSKFTKQADKINKHTYHSKHLPEVNTTTFDNFNKGVIRTMGVCSKIDRGDNIVGLNNSIFESYSSSDTILTQKRGRNARLGVHEIANIYILLPYFMRKTPSEFVQAKTQAVTWANNMLEKAGIDISDIEIIDYRLIKSDE